MFEFCIPTRATILPTGPDWLHEIKYDGYRLRLERDGKAYAGSRAVGTRIRWLDSSTCPANDFRNPPHEPWLKPCTAP